MTVALRTTFQQVQAALGRMHFEGATSAMVSAEDLLRTKGMVQLRDSLAVARGRQKSDSIAHSIYSGSAARTAAEHRFDHL
jgi:hypothetical protein